MRVKARRRADVVDVADVEILRFAQDDNGSVYVRMAMIGGL